MKILLAEDDRETAGFVERGLGELGHVVALSDNGVDALHLATTEQFDLVLFDGPPVLGLADAPLLGAVAEQTLIVVESRETRTANITEMIRRLQASGSNLTGVVLTKVRHDASTYGYNYYSYSYGKDLGDKGSGSTRTIDVNAEVGAAQ